MYVPFLVNFFWKCKSWASPMTHWKRICLQCQRYRLDHWDGKIPWKRKWQHTPVLLWIKSHRQKSLAGYSLWGSKKSDMTEHTRSMSRLISSANEHSIVQHHLLNRLHLISIKLPFCLFNDQLTIFLGSLFWSICQCTYYFIKAVSW